MIPRKVYAVVCDDVIHGFRRHGHHQSGKNEGDILSHEATPFTTADGFIYRCHHKGEAKPYLPYTLHEIPGIGPEVKELCGMKIQDMDC